VELPNAVVAIPVAFGDANHWWVRAEGMAALDLAAVANYQEVFGLPAVADVAVVVKLLEDPVG